MEEIASSAAAPMPDRPALLAIPGLGLGPEAWAPTLSHLRHDRAVMVAPLPGYGLPAPRGRNLHPRVLAVAALESLPPGVRRVVVLGHSASCQIAAHVAARAPERVAGVVLSGPTTDPRAASWPRLAARWLATARHETPRQVPTLVRQYRRTTLRAMARAMEAARHDQIRGVLDGTGVPVLVLRGVHDRICPSDWAAAVAAAGHGGGSAVTLPRGGHMIPLTDGPLVADEVRAFLEQRVDRGR